MVRIHKALGEMNLNAKMLLQVHDELVFEVPPKELETVVECVTKIMEGVHELRVPLKVDIKTGQNWAIVH
jgi:DNA polymerase-1